jgi:hypothetical protein
MAIDLYVGRNNMHHRFTKASNANGLASPPDLFEKRETPRFELGNAYLFQDRLPVVIA